MTLSRMLPIPDGLEGMRIDQALVKLFGFTRTFAQGLVSDGAVTIDGAPATKSQRVRGGEMLFVEWTEPEPLRVEAGSVPDMDVIFEDDDIVVVTKPAGVAAHPSVGWKGPTVLGGLAAAGFKIATSGPAERQGIVQRLDVGTSGLMVVAKSEVAYSVLKRAFKKREVDKTYHAVVQGYPDPLAGTIDGPIARHPGHEWKFAVVAGGRESITHYKTIEVFKSASLLEIGLETGRTHQIRVHMSTYGYPLVGDPLYGSDPELSARLGLERQWLHAIRLGFTHPTSGQRVEFESPYPVDLERALNILRML